MFFGVIYIQKTKEGGDVMDNIKLSDILRDIDTEYTEIDLYNE